jgi:phosphoglycolate phosphatase-like HAD superfamily hydrolase
MTGRTAPTRPTVLLFDVDGTLVTTGGAGRRAIVRALALSGARGGARFSFAGMTDRAIVRRGLEESGTEPREQDIDAVLGAYVALLAEEVAAVPASDYRILPGIVAALDWAERARGVALGLGTGNIREGARIKLGRVGIADRFGFGGFGCDAEDRGAILRRGAARGAAQLGSAPEDCRVVVIGDTPKDIAAAREIDAECIAVGTGLIDLETLAAHHPDHLFSSLAEPGALAAMLGA